MNHLLRALALPMPLVLMTLVLMTPALAACGGREQARCDTCGMIVSPDSGWRAGAHSASGDDLSFDSPKCLFRHALAHESITDAWVIEYYSQERRPAGDLLYVLGSDLESPMGRDLVPVEGREAADRIIEDHPLPDHEGERILRHSEVDSAVIEALF